MLIKYIFFFLISFYSSSHVTEYKGQEESITSSYYIKGPKIDSDDSFIYNTLKSEENKELEVYNNKIFLIHGHDNNHYIKFELKNSSNLEEVFIAGWFELIKESLIYWLEGDVLKSEKLSKFYRVGDKNSRINLYDTGVLIKHPIGEKRSYIIKMNLIGNFAKTNLYISSLSKQIEKKDKFNVFYLLPQGSILLSIILMIYFYFLYRKKYYLYLGLYFSIDLFNVFISHLVNLDSYFTKGIFLRIWIQSLFSYEFYFDFYNDNKRYKYFKYIGRVLQFIYLFLILLFSFNFIESALFFKLRFWLSSLIKIFLTLFLFYLTIKRERFSLWFLFSRIPGIISIVNALSEDYFKFTLYPFKNQFEIILLNSTWLVLFLSVLLVRAREQQAEIEIASNADEFITSLRGASNIQEILNKMIVNIRKYVDYDNAIVYIKDNTTYYLLSTPLFKVSDEDLEEITKLVNKIPRGEYLISRDISSDPLFNNYINSIYYTSVMIVPLNVVEENVGIVVFLSSKYSAYNTTDLGFVKDFAYRAAIITDHHKQLKIISEQRSKIAVEESVRLFQQMVSNEIKSPIYAVKNSIHALRTTYEKRHGILDGDLKEYVECMENSIREAADEVEESLSVISEKSQKFEISYLYDALAYARRICHFELIKLIEENSFKSSYLIKGPKKAIRNALRLVFKNALDSLQDIERDEKIIKVTYEEDGGKLKISLWDNGKGIKKEEADKIFEVFIPGREGRKGQNLMVAKAVVDKVNGQIELESEEDKYTLVNMYLDVIIK